MALKVVPTLAFGAALVLASGPAVAQSLFEQMPSVPEANAPGGAPEAAAQSAAPSAPATVATATAMPTPNIDAPSASIAVPSAKSISSPNGADCGAIQSTLLERKDLISKANTASQSKKKMTPQQACALFGQITANGTRGLKWINENKEWCSIPDSFSEGFKADHLKVSGIRTKVCGMVAQYEKMQAQAREQAQNGGGGGLLGGPGLSGSFKMPQGAL